MAPSPLFVQSACRQLKEMRVSSTGRALELCPRRLGLINIQEIQVGAHEAAEQAVKIPLII